jgi:hypothetical protein
MAAEVLVTFNQEIFSQITLRIIYLKVDSGDNMPNSEDLSNGIKSDMQTVVKKPYEKPTLEILGDLRSITLGGSPGYGESGGGRRDVGPHIPVNPKKPDPNPLRKLKNNRKKTR